MLSENIFWTTTLSKNYPKLPPCGTILFLFLRRLSHLLLIFAPNFIIIVQLCIYLHVCFWSFVIIQLEFNLHWVVCQFSIIIYYYWLDTCRYRHMEPRYQVHRSPYFFSKFFGWIIFEKGYFFIIPASESTLQNFLFDTHMTTFRETKFYTQLLGTWRPP